MVRRATWFLLGMAAVAATGCTFLSHELAGEPQPGTREALMPDTGNRPIDWQDTGSMVTEPAFMVARTQAVWEELWRNIGTRPPFPLPGRTMALAVFLGSRPTAGYAATIETWSLNEAGDLLVQWREKVPPRQYGVAQVMTAPYAVQLVRAVPGRVHFVKSPD